MDADIKFVFQFVVYPLLSALVGAIVIFYHRDLKNLRKLIDDEIKLRKEEVKSLSCDIEDKLDRNRDNIGILFRKHDDMNEKANDVKEKLNIQIERCRITHEWTGEDRRE